MSVRRAIRQVRILGALLVCLAVGTVSAQSDHKLRPQEILNITVAGQPDLSKKYAVEADGGVTLPLIGRLQAAELTAEELARELRHRLESYFKNPQVQVEVERTKRVFVFGGVTAPGMYQLTDNMTLVEVLARAGYTGASEALIVRPKDPRGPAMPDGDGEAAVIRVNLREFEKELQDGQLTRNVVLADGDTIFVPRYDPNRIYVSGQVRNPGAYSVPDGTTVLQALTLAGGPTEHASLGRVRIIRVVNGKQKSLNVKLEDVVQPGDTIIVPERYF